MCTLTLLRDRRGGEGAPHPLWRIVFNRDEQRSRPAGRAPALNSCGAVRTIHPVDPEGGGTWIAATEYGLVLALLNGGELTPEEEAMSPRRSRGEIIPAMAAAASRRAATAPVDDIDPIRYRPFHLVVADDREIVEVTSNGRSLMRGSPCADDWLMRTSSSFETDAVCAWRRRRFEEIASPVSAREQDAFHDRPEPDRPAYGVAMNRPDARTVSTTTMDVFATVISMAYRPRPGEGEVSVIDLVRAL
jgi:hypothetical protein